MSDFIGDDEIRKHGFKIHARPNGKEAMWVRRGQLFSQSEVKIAIQKEPVKEDKK